MRKTGLSNRYVLFRIRYGNKRLTIKPKKAAIEVGDASNLVPTLELLKEAVEAGNWTRCWWPPRKHGEHSSKRQAKAFGSKSLSSRANKKLNSSYSVSALTFGGLLQR